MGARRAPQWRGASGALFFSSAFQARRPRKAPQWGAALPAGLISLSV
jgi:hypothetical protein